jgi:Ca2+-binding RTX toxin-like protein
MTNFSDPANASHLVGLWDFRDGAEKKDTGLADSIEQDGDFKGGASASGGQLHTDGNHDYFDVDGSDDATFADLSEGTIEVQFTQDHHVGSSPDVIVSRGERDDAGDGHEGQFEIRVTKDGSVQVEHQMPDGTTALMCTPNHFFSEGDEINASYAFDAASGASFTVENLSTGNSYSDETHVTGLTLDITDDDEESFTFGARESDDGDYDKFFDGSIDYVAVYNKADLSDGDFIVEGDSTANLIDAAYTGDPEGDSIDAGDSAAMADDDLVDAGAGDDTVRAGADDDTVFAGGGDDSVTGDAGNDVLYGDQSLGEADGNSAVRESFEWDLAPDPNGPNPIENGDPITGFTQNTGSVDVTFDILSSSAHVEHAFQSTDQNVTGIDSGSETIDDNSSFSSEANGSGNTATYALDFNEPGSTTRTSVENVSFRVNDIDGDGVVRVQAFDASGQPVEIELTAGSHLSLSDTDGVAGEDTADSNGGYLPDSSAEYSILVEIAGPVSQIVVQHGQDGGANSGINISDVYFDVPAAPGEPGNDTLEGGAGHDEIFGEEGDDLITGGSGNDTVDGGAGNDELRGNSGDDSVDGGAGDDSMGGAEGDDTLQGGAGHDTLSGGSGDDVMDGGDDADTINGNSGNDEITDTDGDNLITSGIDGLPDRGFPFVPGTEDPDPNDDRDSVTTGAGADTILTGDDDDVIDAGDGQNVIDAGYDDDSINAGSGDDEITSGEGSDTVTSGGGDDTIFGGLGPVLGSSANLIDENVDPSNNDPILDNGDDSIDAGAGDDLVLGEDDNDTIDGGSGDDTLDGGVDDDVVAGGAGDDAIVGGQGADEMSGGVGDDTFDVGLFNDPIFGDTYVEGAGDTVVGGEDADDTDIDVLDLSDGGPLSIDFDDAVDPGGEPGESGTVTFFTDNTQNTVAGTLTFSEIENVIPCFTPGSLIATPKGEVPVESLREGDKVITRDNGIQEIRWVGHRTLNRDELARAPNLKPVLIKAGSLGYGLPERDMLVSPQHRVLVAGDKTQLYFDESEVLVAAKHLVNHGSIQSVDTLRTTYVHFMFDRHEVVLSDGAWTESFQPGDQSLGAMGPETREEIVALFPELATPEGVTDYTAARRSLKSYEAKLLQL